MTRKFCLTAAVFALLTVTAPARASTVFFDDFSSGFSGWTTGGLGNHIQAFTPATDGGLGYAIGFGSTNGFDNTLTASVPTIAGTTYDFSFTLSNNGGSPNDFAAFLNGSPVYSVVNAAPFSPTVFSDILTATGATTVEFSGANAPAWFYLQDASVSDVSAVPLPAALPLFGSAVLGLAGFGARKSRRTKRG